jgi:Virulence-associated protein E
MSNRKKPADEQRALVEANFADASSREIVRDLIQWPEITGKNNPKPNSMMNATAVIGALRLRCEHDIFHDRKSVEGTELRSFTGDLADPIVRKFQELAFIKLGYNPGKQATEEALLRRCEENRFHPIMDYLDGLVWDGTPRLDRWLSIYCGVEDTPLVRAQGAIVIMAAVCRIYKPGTKFDHVLVLEGEEGVRKSSVVKVLANGTLDKDDNFSDSPVLGLDERKQMELTCGVWFYELAELANMKKADMHGVKNFITKQVERARAAYDRFQREQPRTCIFIGTFNTAPGTNALITYLNPGDQRRWWGVRVGEIDIEALQRDRDQLFAEAMVRYNVYRLGLDPHPKLYLPPELEAEARAIAGEREIVDPLADTLSDLYASILHIKDAKYPLTPDGVPIEVKSDDCESALTKGGDARPFAYVDADRVWVASAYIVERVPAARKGDGRGINNAMTKQGWTAKKYRGARGWERPIEAEALP